MSKQILNQEEVNSFYEQIKNELVDAIVHKKVREYTGNRYELEKYYNVGKLIVEAQGGEEKAKYGNSLIKDFSKKLIVEIGKQYNERTLRRIRQFYFFCQRLKWSTISTILDWSHYVELLPIEDNNAINYYVYLCKKNSLTVRELRAKIKSQEYERLDSETKNKLINKEETTITDLIPNPIIIRINEEENIISEKALKGAILADMEYFLEELGEGYSFIKSEYKIKIGNVYNYIDLLLYNIEYNCYVVVELKVTDLKKEHFGQIKTYMNYIDMNIKKNNQDKTIGIIICRKNNKFLLKYSSDPRIKLREFVINHIMHV